MSAATIALLNQKGGVGKSSCVHHLAGSFSKLGNRVLLVDLDPQSSLTQGIIGPPETRDLDPECTVDAVFRSGASAGQVIRPSGLAGVDLVPGSRRAATFNTPDPHEAPIDRQLAIRNLLDGVGDDYDIILIDCPPNLYLASWAALIASQFIICPLAPEDYAAQGLADVQESIELVRSGPNPDLTLLGYLVGMKVARKSVHQIFEKTLRQGYGSLVFEATIPHSADFSEAVMNRLPVQSYKPKGQGAKSMMALADEILRRIEEARGVFHREVA